MYIESVPKKSTHELDGRCARSSKSAAHPVILWGAWLRVDSWYKYGELAPQPELSYWRLHPEARLRELAEAFRRDDWSPDRWPQVPYPKKGGRLRHYAMPAVRDQVAFMAHMVALGPILDQQIVNFAFGNRWYRPIAWDSADIAGTVGSSSLSGVDG